MKKAIKKVLPNAAHRLYSWHIEKNAGQYVGNKQFLQAFKTCMFMNCSQDQFEFEWASMVSKLHLGNNEWVKKIHKKKEQWAVAYLRGNFFAGMRSTQRCEKMNDVLKMYLKPEFKLFEFVRAFDLAISWLRTEEARNETNTQHTTLLPITELHCLENHAAEVFSRRIFLMVREQLKSQGIYYRVDGIDDGVQCVHMISHSYSGSEWRVQYNRHSGEMRYSCMRMESLGLPCGHMFRIMVFEGMRKIPDSCIMKRWSRIARDSIGGDWEGQPPDTENLEMGRYAALVGACNSWCYYAAKSSAGFKLAMGVIHRETNHARSLCMAKATDAATLLKHEAGGQRGCKFGVLDPLICRAKGDHQTKEKGRLSNKKCGNCGSRDGHNRRTCNSSPKNTAWHEITGASYDGEHGWTADEDAGSRHQSIISHYEVRVCSLSEGQCGSLIQQPSYEWNQKGFAGVQEGRCNELDAMDALELAEW
ncbi:protein FAR1-RELATED SEQUENCE 5-like [Coffea eugenioides]|uniref:protein FAR1-RELATED SEQUENCE 5-like n=1 Tax=Coffea eugenioides TaxID=49369 RepID=UPI000F60EED4|nr:protein FAR1-RELATED SEQUENCE 5-like [Coffea eugenioides]